MKILIDDERTHLPDGSVPDLIVRRFQAAIDLWFETDIDWTELYLDHDLGPTGSGYDFMVMLENQAEAQKNMDDLPGKIVCVSDNGPGRQRIEQVIQKLYGRLFYV